MPQFLIKKEEIFLNPIEVSQNAPKPSGAQNPTNSTEQTGLIQQDKPIGQIELKDSENLSHLIKALRVRIGENVKFIDEEGFVYISKITEIAKNPLFLKAEILKKEKSKRILDFNICLLQAVLAPDGQQAAVANATQAGVKELYPVITENCTVSKKNLTEKTIAKWQKIAFENFKQCERGDNLKIKEIINLKDALNEFEPQNIIIFAEKYENMTLEKSLEDINSGSKVNKSSDKIGLVIGPEGGFSENEFKFFKEKNYKMVSLGKMIYKAPNAIIAAVSNVVTRLEEKEQEVFNDG